MYIKTRVDQTYTTILCVGLFSGYNRLYKNAYKNAPLLFGKVEKNMQAPHMVFGEYFV